jgi:D-cysteine desulfhydrase family pyridoxal phosphate-dependent enzyme
MSDEARPLNPRQERRPIALQVDYPDRQGYLVEWTETVSASGMFIRTHRQHHVGERLRLNVSFPGLLDPIPIVGVVAWIRAPEDRLPGGIGVHVESPEHEDRLARLMPLADQPSANVGPYKLLSLLPRVRLGQFPTPLQRADRLTELLGGPEIWFKRDDLTAFGLGGNKVRKLEFLAADALARGCDSLVTGAKSPQSNHVRLTMAVAAHLGLKGIAVVSGSQVKQATGNLLLTDILGGNILPADSVGMGNMDDVIEGAVEELRLEGLNPYGIPVGGATWLGTTGYVLATLELVDQLRRYDVSPVAVVTAVGACGTLAGLELGARWLETGYRAVGISISRPRQACQERASELLVSTSAHLGLPISAPPEEITVVEDYIGPGYGVSTPAGMDAIRLVARAEGIFLDPVYTGKAMAGLIDLIKRGVFHRGQQIVFLHTGGWPALFA